VRDSRALILDVRPNGGGDELLALDAAARFVTAERVVTYSRWRVGPHHDDLSSPRARTVAPRGPWAFTKPVFLLVGAASASANESFIAALAGLPNVVVLGDTTAGSSASPREFFLGGGWRFTVPQTITYTAGMAEIEWRGIAPDVYVPVPAGSWEARVDPVLEAALARTRAAEQR
jgi:C-terminal processing protease CtpA/Prc